MNLYPTHQTKSPPGWGGYTAAQIASSLGVSPQAIRQQLRRVNPTGRKIISGNETLTWDLAVLPAALVSRLDRAARAKGFQGPEEMFRAEVGGWTPPVPLSEISDECLAKAAKWKAALLPSVRKNFVVCQFDFEREGVADVEGVFGHRISARHFRGLVQRARERDGGQENWEKLELYLPKRPARKRKVSEPKPDFMGLLETINDSSRPFERLEGNRMVKVKGDVLIWEHACRTLEKMDGPVKRAKRLLLDFLCEYASSLASNREALQKMFARRFARWQRRERFDLRKGNCGADDGELTKQIKALDWFIPAARFFYLITNRTEDSGSTPEAVRYTIDLPNLPVAWSIGSVRKNLLRKLDLRELPSCPPGLREEIRQRARAGKPLVPLKIARKIQVNPTIVKFHRAPGAWAQDNLCAPGSQRRYLNRETVQREVMAPGDWFGGDDATPGIAVCVPVSEREIASETARRYGVLLGRFQWLVFHDCRTDKILAWDYVIRPRGSYRAEDILVGMGAVTRTHGIPRHGWQFEGGTFNSKLVRQAIAHLGCEHWRTYSPHQKSIESVFNRVWTQLAVQFPHADLGRYRNENEKNCRLYEACRRGNKDPRRYFPPLDLLVAAFNEVVGKMNGRMIRGVQYGHWEPDEFFDRSVAESPLRKFSLDMEWIFSPFAVERKVHGAMVRCRVPMFEGFSVPFEFAAEWLPLYNGRLVRLHFDPRQPRCTAKVVLLERCGEHQPGEVLGDAQMIGETAGSLRYVLGFGAGNGGAGYLERQRVANYMRRETRGIGVGGRVEYAASEERDGLTRIGKVERDGQGLAPGEDVTAQSKKRLARNLGGMGSGERRPVRREDLSLAEQFFLDALDDDSPLTGGAQRPAAPAKLKEEVDYE